MVSPSPEPAPGPVVLALVGPTASGKSDLALEVADSLPFSVEIVSCDAFQIYRRLDIGSGTPTTEMRARRPHHLLDALEPDDPCTAGRYAELAAATVRDVWRRRAVPLVVGGSGLYFRALRDGIFEGPAADPRLRARLAAIYRRPSGPRWMERLLARIDPAVHRRVHPNDWVRRVRALEVALAAGEPISRLQATRRPPLPEAEWRIAGLDPPRDLLEVRIGGRVRGMFASGLVEEVQGLSERYPGEWPGRLAIGYREVLGVLAEEPSPRDLPDRFRAAEERVVIATRRYAKRQLTWFRAERDVTWVRGAAGDPAALEGVERVFLGPA
ncbi:MAG: tRNA (adenosine(37)-N6)-dimethylallyltransferase MiaA [Acidobacteriota bacterium]|nr:tRNA (adenosine(37)-N6)-dimethylallyltransferase MiaA [Acidobacteriota bacterium]